MSAAPTNIRLSRRFGASLAWDANPSGDNVTTYKLYYGASSGTYDGSSSPIDMGNVTSYRFDPGLIGITYLALTAVNANGESSFSSELSRTF